MSTVINHTEYPKSLKAKNADMLRFIIKDCQEAVDANPHGIRLAIPTQSEAETPWQPELSI